MAGLSAFSAVHAVTLSPRQLAVLAAYARVGDQRQAAYDLGLSLRSVKESLTVAYRKLGARNVLEACLIKGWLQVPEVNDIHMAVPASRLEV